MTCEERLERLNETGDQMAAENRAAAAERIAEAAEVRCASPVLIVWRSVLPVTTLNPAASAI